MTQPFADPTALLAMARRDGRQLAFHLVLMGLACLVAALLVTSLPRVVGLLLALLLLVVVAAAVARFLAAHRATLQRWGGVLQGFWAGTCLAALMVLLGRLLLGRVGWLPWCGGVLGLLCGLAAGHLVFYGSRALTDDGSATRTH